MSKVIESEEYLTTNEVLRELSASKKRFYSNVKPYLQAYHFDAKKSPWYRKRDVLDLKSGKPIRKAAISISGIQRDWTTYLRSQGFHVESLTCSIEIAPLPEDAVTLFKLPANQHFVKRSRMTIADDVRICRWDSYYPLDLVEGDILEEMKRDLSTDVVLRIQEKHGITVAIAKDKYTARNATLAEQELLELLTNEPVLILQRASYTQGKTRLVLFSDMTLLGSWFAPEHEYEVNIWDKPLSSNAPLQPPREHSALSASNILPDGYVPLNELLKQHNLERQRKSVIAYLEKQGKLHRGDWTLSGHVVNLALDESGVEEFMKRYVR